MSNASAKSFDCGVVRALRGVSRAGAAHLAELVRRALPPCCELCVAPTDGALLCAGCTCALPRVSAACPVCALPSPDAAVCGACLRHPPPYAATVAALVYAFPVDRLVRRIKYGGRLALADWAGDALAAAVRHALVRRTAGERPELVVALPLAGQRQRERGFNQAREIAARVAQAIALPLGTPLERIAGGPPQAALPWSARRRNVQGAFAVQADVRGARIALVDDVMTTGSTLAEAARTLARAGVGRVECWVLARALPPEGTR